MEMITVYEVEGCWTQEREVNPTLCRLCGTKLEKVPEKGHYNSKYWSLKQNDGLDLFCCPNGCSTKKADKAFKKYYELKPFLTEESTSYNIVLDYTKIFYGWLSPRGELHPVGFQEHNYYATEVLNKSERELEVKGWAKLSKNSCFSISKEGFTKKQKDFIFDYMIAHNYDVSCLYEDEDEDEDEYIINFKEKI